MANIMSTPKGQQCAWHSTRSTIILSCTWVGLGDGTCKRCKSKQSQRQPHIACIQLQQGPCQMRIFFGGLIGCGLTKYLVLHFRHSTSSTFFLSKLWVGSASSWQNLRVQNFPILDLLSLFSHLFLKTFSLPHSLSSFLHFLFNWFQIVLLVFKNTCSCRPLRNKALQVYNVSCSEHSQALPFRHSCCCCCGLRIEIQILLFDRQGSRKLTHRSSLFCTNIWKAIWI